jgi:putative DNA primase/helicase
MKLNPVFDDLNNPATILNHVEELKSKSEAATPHAEILNQLIEQFEPLDFEGLAFPQAEKLKNWLREKSFGAIKANDSNRLRTNNEKAIR